MSDGPNWTAPTGLNVFDFVIVLVPVLAFAAGAVLFPVQVAVPPTRPAPSVPVIVPDQPRPAPRPCPGPRCPFSAPALAK